MHKTLVCFIISCVFMLVGCKHEERISNGGPLGHFYVSITDAEGTDLLDTETSQNVLNEISEFIIDGKSYHLAWQIPFSLKNYPKVASLLQGESGYNAITTDFNWWYSVDYPVDFKLSIGQVEVPFTLYPENGGNILLLPDGRRENVFVSSFIIFITYQEDGITLIDVKNV